MRLFYSFIYNNVVLRVFLFILFRFFYVFIFFRKKIILTRTACLGNDSLKLLDINFKIIPHQKCRIDLLNILLNKKYNIKFNFDVTYFISRSDIYELYIQQCISNWNLKTAPLALVMDSYSELTDQKFTFKADESSFFFANFNDLNKRFIPKLISNGLLNEFQISNEYSKFFSLFRERYPNCPIIFINFPKKLETRAKFITRHDMISSIINEISLSVTHFYVINIPDYLVLKHPNDDFPYHYSSESYVFVSENIKQILKKYNLF